MANTAAPVITAKRIQIVMAVYVHEPTPVTIRERGDTVAQSGEQRIGRRAYKRSRQFQSRRFLAKDAARGQATRAFSRRELAFAAAMGHHPTRFT
jgi:hypothetical protein